MTETLLQKAQRLGIRPENKSGQVMPQSAKTTSLLLEAQESQKESERINNPLGQTKETVKAMGEMLGITPTGRRIAVSIAPYITPEEQLPIVLNELDSGGIEKKRTFSSQAKEFSEIAMDLPLFSLGLSKAISGTLTKQAIKSTPELAKFLSKSLSEFAPDALKRFLDTDLFTPIKEKVGETFDSTKNLVERGKLSLFGKSPEPTSIDEVIQQADEGMKPSEVLARTEQITSKPSLFEKWAGISSDIKNRISGKSQKLKEYFDVAHARNNFDTLPTPLEHGAKNVDRAVSDMEKVLNDTGGKIGIFRKKIGTYEANIDRVNKIGNSFIDELKKLNLEIKKGKIVQTLGTIRRINSNNEIKILDDLYKDLLTLKQNPNLEKLIDLRTLFDKKINFEKSTREVSSSLDPLSRKIRKNIADVSAEVVGKSEALNLKKYSEFIDAYSELKSYADRKAGAEFLLKQVLSERGRTPREIIQTIKEFTGIDLMDDAVMSSIATDLIANPRQKGIFRQEITKAGLDAQAVLQGNTRGAVDLMFNFLKKGLVNEEKQFLKAAK